ncbi:MAG: isocitrate lyase/phosphoenolpyruvate mutase family protein [Ginsengibacter sp.]
MFSENIQNEKEKQFHLLHHNEELLILPNIWDPLGAKLLEDVGYKAVATASASIAYTNGMDDGEKITFDEVIQILKKIVNSVKIPVTADIESGYAPNNSILKENIKKLIDIGISGINFEDSNHREQNLFSKEEQSEKINLIRKIASENGSNLFINARTDVFIQKNYSTKEEKISEAIERGNLYKDAGADGFYPILLVEKDSIEILIREVGLPVNVLMLPGIPDFNTLKKIGVARISLGPGFLKTALHAMKHVSEKLLHFEGMEEITMNTLTSDYIKKLI